MADEGGVDTLLNHSYRSSTPKSRTNEADELAVADYAAAFPANGQHRTSYELRKQGVSPAEVFVLSGYLMTLRFQKTPESTSGSIWEEYYDFTLFVNATPYKAATFTAF